MFTPTESEFESFPLVVKRKVRLHPSDRHHRSPPVRSALGFEWGIRYSVLLAPSVNVLTLCTTISSRLPLGLLLLLLNCPHPLVLE